MDALKTFDKTVEQSLSPILKEQNLAKPLLHLFLMLYAAKIAPELPPVVTQLFDNMYFKLVIFALILWTAQFSPSTAILISIAFLVSTNFATKGKVWEFLENVVVDKEMSSGSEAVTVSPEVVAVAPEAPQEITPEMAETAVVALAAAASSEEAAKPQDVVEVAQVAADGMKTDEGIVAVKALAEAAMEPTAAPPAMVQEAVEIAKDSMQKLGCLPRRQVDMSKIIGYGEVDKYSTFP